MKKFLKWTAVFLSAVLIIGLSAGLIIRNRNEEADPKTLIYGVDGVGQKDPALKRTDSAVGLTYTVGISEIHSDFDNCYPWSDMEEVTDEADNVFIKIPKFYAKITKNADGTYKHQISGTKYPGYSTLFIAADGAEIPYVLVGKYEGSGSSDRVYSKSGQEVFTYSTIDNYRTACIANGAGYQQYDFLIDLIIKELWLVEMATTNSQSVMYGYANGNTEAIITGETDGVKTPSGSLVNNADGKHSMKYRGIENLYGNTWTYVDGISFDNEKVYVCFDPTAYISEVYSGAYIYQGCRAMYGFYVEVVYPSCIEPLGNHPLIQYVTYCQGDASTYYCDSYATMGTVLLMGGNWTEGDDGGLWCYLDMPSTSAYSNRGGRLCYKPVGE